VLKVWMDGLDGVQAFNILKAGRCPATSWASVLQCSLNGIQCGQLILGKINKLCHQSNQMSDFNDKM